MQCAPFRIYNFQAQIHFIPAALCLYGERKPQTTTLVQTIDCIKDERSLLLLKIKPMRKCNKAALHREN